MAEGAQVITLEDIGRLAILWCEADEDSEARWREGRPIVKAARLRERRLAALRGAIRDYKLLRKEGKR